MPNIDGGHYFLTVLAPVRIDFIADKTPGRSRSHRHQLAQRLALLDTGRQTLASPLNDPPSPFAGNTMNHFVRFAIIDGPPYNGRMSWDTLYNALREIDPLVPQPVDRLSRPYLLFSADLDVHDDEARTLSDYAEQLWTTMKPHDIRRIFEHCAGFEGVDTADKFCGYLAKCQVETTMPFNDYWLDGLPAGSVKLPITPLLWSAIAAVGLLVVWLAALALYGPFVAFRVHSEFASGVARIVGWGVILLPLLFGLLALTAFGLYRWILRKGQAPFATAEGCDLPSVLKSLYLQQVFTRFAIEAQGFSAAQLHTSFGAFLAAAKPDQADSPTQSPGEVRATP